MIFIFFSAPCRVQAVCKQRGISWMCCRGHRPWAADIQPYRRLWRGKVAQSRAWQWGCRPLPVPHLPILCCAPSAHNHKAFSLFGRQPNHG